MVSSHRLHPLSVVFLVIGTLKGFLLPGALLVFTARGSSWELWALWLSVPMTGYAIFRYFVTRYGFADDELVIQTGLLFRNVRHIRYSRIQNIETVQNLLHRGFKVAEVRVETGGGNEQEARLVVLSLDAVDEMRRRVFEGKRLAAEQEPAGPVASSTPRGFTRGTAPYESSGAVVSPPPAAVDPADTSAVGSASDRVLVRLRVPDLVLFGLVQNRGGLVIAAVLGVLWEADIMDWDTAGRSNLRSIVEHAVAMGWFRSWDVAVFATLAGIFIAFLLAVRVLSVGWAIVRLYDFTLTRAGDELRTSCGLFTKVRTVIPMRRIQLVSMRQAPLQRAFARVELRVQTAGGDKGASASREWLSPMLRREDVDALMAEVLPGPGFDALEWHAVDPRAGRREIWTYLRTLAVVVLATVWLAPPITIVAAVPLAILAIIAGRKRGRSFGYALAGDRVASRGGWLWRSTSMARYAKVQAVAMGETPFDRRWKMARVFADTAGGGPHRVAIPYLPVEQARALFDDLSGRVNETAFRW
ncbi:MAG TPA: PH domain-containing protein [Candidatus Krumholzibacteria bacterium]|nr:PH domain-containing protein [Candidatus Krumholzibacteria bacterium]